jgi:RNA polymerase sigma factor (sigma-70 family)
MDIKNISDLYDLRIESINTGYDDEDTKAFENSKEFVSHSCVTESDVYDEDNSYTTEVLEHFTSYLEGREKTIIQMAYGLNKKHRDYSNEEIATALGISTERVRQIRKSAIEKMKEHVAEVQFM